MLTVEIGIDTLACAALCSDFAWECADERTGRPGMTRPDKLFKISNPRGFAADVARELTDEAEDGSSLLTKVIDAACQKAVEEGSEWWIGTGEDVNE